MVAALQWVAVLLTISVAACHREEDASKKALVRPFSENGTRPIHIPALRRRYVLLKSQKILANDSAQAFSDGKTANGSRKPLLSDPRVPLKQSESRESSDSIPSTTAFPRLFRMPGTSTKPAPAAPDAPPDEPKYDPNAFFSNGPPASSQEEERLVINEPPSNAEGNGAPSGSSVGESGNRAAPNGQQHPRHQLHPFPGFHPARTVHPFHLIVRGPNLVGQPLRGIFPVVGSVEPIFDRPQGKQLAGTNAGGTRLRVPPGVLRGDLRFTQRENGRSLIIPVPGIYPNGAPLSSQGVPPEAHSGNYASPVQNTRAYEGSFQQPPVAYAQRAAGALGYHTINSSPGTERSQQYVEIDQRYLRPQYGPQTGYSMTTATRAENLHSLQPGFAPSIVQQVQPGTVQQVHPARGYSVNPAGLAYYVADDGFAPQKNGAFRYVPVAERFATGFTDPQLVQFMGLVQRPYNVGRQSNAPYRAQPGVRMTGVRRPVFSQSTTPQKRVGYSVDTQEAPVLSAPHHNVLYLYRTDVAPTCANAAYCLRDDPRVALHRAVGLERQVMKHFLRKTEAVQTGTKRAGHLHQGDRSRTLRVSHQDGERTLESRAQHGQSSRDAGSNHFYRAMLVRREAFV